MTAKVILLLSSLPVTTAFFQPESLLNRKSFNHKRYHQFHYVKPMRNDLKENENKSYIDECDKLDDESRRNILQSLICTAALIPLGASAGKPEIDSSGQLFAPKSDMVRGGSELTRGIKLESNSKRPITIKPGQTVQTVYETRFMAYLSRFLLNFDPAIRNWWEKQGVDSLGQSASMPKAQAAIFAEFAESVEVGLSDYFVGPYGSYGSVAAAKAGINARQQVKSDQSNQGRRKSEKKAKQGVLNLYALLKARYTSIEAKRQLAILFTLITRGGLQPTDEIRSLLGEADDATITKVELSKPPKFKDVAECLASSRRGGGYSINFPPEIVVDSPPALGSAYQGATLKAVMRTTSRVLKIEVVDGGQGYSKPPNIKVSQSDIGTPCEACAILDRKGHLESIIVLDPGYGYGKGGQGGQGIPPKVFIEPPKNKDGSTPKGARTATAEAELEYEIAEIDIVSGGNGYVATEFPNIRIEPPLEDPDWYVKRNIYNPLEAVQDVFSLQAVTASVKEMKTADGQIIDIDSDFEEGVVNDEVLSKLKSDPLQLLPSATRPRLIDSLIGLQYSVPSLPALTTPVAVPSARYRAFDPVFGPIGKVPVTKGALELSNFEYTRLGLSGAVCTVIVRTMLNPLELVKTKIQLGNDKEINEYASNMKKGNQKDANHKDVNHNDTNHVHNESGKVSIEETTTKVSVEETTEVSAEETTEEDVGTLDIIKSLIKLRGVGSLFQSADITFLASLVFGSFGFGATELFRRSFTMKFFSENSGQTGEELILLAAAALATVVTAAAASPFEVLRVKSMGLVEAKSWREVLDLFLEEKKGANSTEPFNPKELLPLWGGFAPTVSRELPFAVTKFLVFDLLAKAIVALINSNIGEGAIPIKVGTGTIGLAVSAASGAVAGVAGAFVSHPADLILTLTSSSKDGKNADWKEVVSELTSREGGITNLFVGLPARSVFFFLVIGLQFFLYDYVKNIFQVGSEDLSLVLDVFYAVRQGLVYATTG